MKLKKEQKSRLKFFSPAKLNLFFRVLGKCDDGYHEIATLMQAISLCDILYFELAEKDCITSTHPNLPCDERNLVYQALQLFRKKTGLLFPVKIHIEKRIPIEGGFGGGSSNLATTLWALNTITRRIVQEETLREWAGNFSCDAPFFFSSGTAYCTGRGEKIKSLSPLCKRNLYLAKSSKGMSTPEVYRHCRPHACSSEDPLKLLASPKYVNDLEVSAFQLCPSLLRLKEDLLDLGFETAVMTGSGSGFFCFGKVKNPQLSGVQFLRTSFFSRIENSWYNSPECEKIHGYGYRTL